jgi:hypothetical protein
MGEVNILEVKYNLSIDSQLDYASGIAQNLPLCSSAWFSNSYKVYANEKLYLRFARDPEEHCITWEKLQTYKMRLCEQVKG